MLDPIHGRFDARPGRCWPTAGSRRRATSRRRGRPPHKATVYAQVPKPRDPARDRHEPLPGDGAAVAALRRRMKADEAKAIFKERASTAECVNAQARNRGLIRLPVRGLEKVKAVTLWLAVAHNLTCGMRLRAQATA